MREERLVKQNEALVRLARSEKLAGGQWMEILGEVTEAAARALETERTSVWLYDAMHSRLHCANLFELSQQRHSSGAELAAQDFQRISRPCGKSIRSRLTTPEPTLEPESSR